MTEKELMQYNILKRLIEKREEDIEKEIVDAEEKIAKIEKFISEISDPELKLIFEMRYYRNMKWPDIASEMGILSDAGEIVSEKNRTKYIRKFKKYLKKCTKCTHCTN